MTRRRDYDAMGHAVEKIEKALDAYALAHFEAYDSKIGEDAVLGEAWLKVLKGASELLNGETGYLLGPYGTAVYVWAPDFESAFEILVEWADEEAPGYLVDVTEKDLREAAEEEGVDWPKGESLRHFEERVGERTLYKVVEAAEADLTLIGHTTLKHGQYVPSHEWGGDEVTDFSEWLAVVARSAKGLDRDDRDEVGERLRELREQKKRKAKAR